MAKYNEIMDRIKVTEEMSSRVLQNVERHFAETDEKKKDFDKSHFEKRNSKRIWFTGLVMAAAAAVLFIAVRQSDISHGIRPAEEQQPQVLAVNDTEEYTSAEELVKAVGFAVGEPAELPFEVKETVYRKSFGFAEIEYIGEADTFTYRKSEGTEDISGDYNVYPVEKEVSVGEISVTMKGDDDGIHLAIWTDGKYAYSLDDQKGISEQEMLQQVETVIDKN